jgi:hypothetical protein
MRGVIMTEFLGWVEESRGLATVDELVSGLSSDLTDGGAYTAVGDYPHGELIALMQALAEHDGSTLDDIQRQFGRAAFASLATVGAPMLLDATCSRDVFSRINDVIHVEVRKLYPEAHPPSVAMIDVDPNEVIIDYGSHRPMADLCVGLVQGALDFYQESAEVTIDENSFTPDSARIRVRWSALA